MKSLRYIEDAPTLALDVEKCTGCRMCTVVCPHAVFEMRDSRATIVDRGACMECGACALNCASGAISVDPGVGCAEAIIRSWITGGPPTCGPGCGGDSEGDSCCSTDASSGSCC
ncbi:MAG: 4Fe-4S binding protein [Coriobacteriales bacterium]|nr:4Fe-4S binding protein [Coriobacteriales bacterium]